MININRYLFLADDESSQKHSDEESDKDRTKSNEELPTRPAPSSDCSVTLSSSSSAPPKYLGFVTGWFNQKVEELGFSCPFCDKKYCTAELLASHAIYKKCPYSASTRVTRCKICKCQIHGRDKAATDYHYASKHNITTSSSSSSSVTCQATDSSKLLNTAFCEEKSQGQTGGECICIATL
jgi:hypothetical protein